MNTEMVTVVRTASDGHRQRNHQHPGEHLDSRYQTINTGLPEIPLDSDPHGRDYPTQEGDLVYPTPPGEGQQRGLHLGDTSGGGGSNLDLVISQTLLAGVEIHSHQFTPTSACREGQHKPCREGGLLISPTMTIAQYEDPLQAGGSYGGNLQNPLETLPQVAGYYDVNTDGVAVDNNDDYNHNHNPHPHPQQQDIWDQGNHAGPRQDLLDAFDGYESNSPHFPRHYDHQDQFCHHHQLGFHHHRHHLQNHMHQNYHEFPDDHGFFLATHHNGFGSGSPGNGHKPKRRRVPTLAQRRAANIRERRRMYNLNEAFDQLRTKVPTFAYEKRLSRIETLRLAMTYISFMTEVVREKVDKERVTQNDKDISEEDDGQNDDEICEEDEDAKDKSDSGEMTEDSQEDAMSEPASRNT